MIASYRRLDELDAPPRPVKYPRLDPGHRPLGEENPGNGWVWKCSIPGAAEGPLSGVRVAIKDNICLAGIPMLNGTEMLEGFVPREDATVVTRLLDAGAEIVGKTAVPAFCFDGGSVTGYPAPEPQNPYDAARLPGASSSGSAVVVALGEADMALGGDQGGSIRMPASWSGIVGHKPTWGLVPYTGAFPIELTLDHLGPMCRSVRDCARMLEVIAGPDGLDPRQGGVEVQPYVQELDRGAERLRVGILTEGFGWPEVSEADVDEAVRAAAQTFEGLGATLGEVSVPIHRDGLAIWTAIAAEGATELMVKGNGMGTNWRGHYTTDLSDFYGKARTLPGTRLLPDRQAHDARRGIHGPALRPPLLRKGSEPQPPGPRPVRRRPDRLRRARDADDRDEGAPASRRGRVGDRAGRRRARRTSTTPRCSTRPATPRSAFRAASRTAFRSA